LALEVLDDGLLNAKVTSFELTGQLVALFLRGDARKTFHGKQFSHHLPPIEWSTFVKNGGGFTTCVSFSVSATASFLAGAL
jgi:hypothetical protein